MCKNAKYNRTDPTRLLHKQKNTTFNILGSWKQEVEPGASEESLGKIEKRPWSIQGEKSWKDTAMENLSQTIWA